MSAVVFGQVCDDEAVQRPRYLYIRLLEACNAGCFMCSYAKSRDKFRFGLSDFKELLPEARRVGVKFVRLTGGEPLMHKEVLPIIKAGTGAGIAMSLVTNGTMLPGMANDLAKAGLDMLVVSVDAADADIHNRLRLTPNGHEKAIEGLRLAIASGIKTRVNTVVGPHNYRQMTELQQILTSVGVEQWELSALKLTPYPTYDDRLDVMAVGEQIYSGEGLQPIGKRWYGDTTEERSRYFDEGIPPRASAPGCRTAKDVIYLDAKNEELFVCPCLPHRPDDEGQRVRLRQTTGEILLDSSEFHERQNYFMTHGPSVCTGCSTSASGYSDLAHSGGVGPWSI